MAPPSKYKPDFCEQVIDHLKGGESLESFCCKIGVSFETLNTWRKKRRAFSDAVGIAEQYSKLWWESLGRRILLGQSVPVPGGRTLEPEKFNTQLYGLLYRNRFGDPRQKIEHTGEDGKPIKTETKVTVRLVDARVSKPE